MDLLEEHSLYFEAPARDPLGREAMAGKLQAAADKLYFHWRFKERTFRKSDGNMTSIPVGYEQVELLEYKATLGVFKPRVHFRVTDPKLLEGVPGVDVGYATLHVSKKAKAEFKKLKKYVEFKKSEMQAMQARQRLNDIEGRAGENPTL
jgi:hypothetical protein